MWIPILFVIFVTKVQCELLLVSQANSLHCVSTDEHSALEWIFPTNDRTLSITESSTGWRSQNEKQEKFYCNFRENCPGLPEQNIKINTEIETSGNNFGPITDTRWNYFPVKGATYGQKLPARDNLIFHLSILAQDDGFIILSADEILTSSSKAYWFVLDGWGKNTSSVLRKCSRGIYEGTYCPTVDAKYKDRVLANGKRWVHFTVEIKKTKEFNNYGQNVLTKLEITLTVEGRVYLQWTDTKNLFNIQYVSFQRYQNKPAFWKYHQYNVFQQKQNALEMPIQTTAEDGRICVSLTYFSDKEITVQILGSNNVLATQTFQSTENKWKVQRIEAKTSHSGKYNLQINKDSSTVLYLGEIRTCHTNEFYVTKLKVAKSQFSSIKCRNSHSNEEIKVSDKLQENVCDKKSSFGANCGLSCKTILGGSCTAGQMCDPRGCFCLPGYEGVDCNTACYNDNYGTDCSGTCGKCASFSCDTQTGVCTSGCTSKLYKTPFCTEEYPILKADEFEIIATPHGTAEFRLITQGLSKNYDNTKLLFQFKGPKQNTWENSSLIVWHSKQTSIAIPGLHIKTKYQIRPILIDNVGEVYFETPQVEITTQCKLADQNDINIKWTDSTTIQFNWKNNDNKDLKCPIQDYNIRVNGETKQLGPNLTIANLTAGTHEVIILFGEQEIKKQNINFDQDMSKHGTPDCPVCGDHGVVIVVTIVVLLLIIASIVVFCVYRKYSYKDEKRENKNLADMRANRHNIQGSGFIPLPEREERLGVFERYLPIQLRARLRKFLRRFQTSTISSAPANNPMIPVPQIPNNPPPPVPLSSPSRHVPSRSNQQRNPLNINVPNRNNLINVPRSIAPSAPPLRPRSITPNSTPSMSRSRTATERPHSVFPTSRSSEFLNVPDVPPPVLPRAICTYGTVDSNYSNPVRISEFETYVEVSLATGELRKQHALFPRGQTQSWDYGRLAENKMKNRYGNLVAYDVTRVKLTFLPGDQYSDYINANYIDGYKAPKKYIATQGPKPQTINDFWRMVWQENINILVMLANVVENGKVKCDKYWPDLAQVQMYGDIKINNLTEQVFADYTYRSFLVTCNNVNRKAVHLHFTSWPDHGVPIYPQSVSAFLKKMQSFRSNGPILVHCSAGVGRTGTILLADSCLRMAAEEQRVDALSLLQKMRAQRSNMVDNADQYELVHLVILEHLSESFNFPCSKFKTELGKLMKDNNWELNRRFNAINQVCSRDTLRVLVQGEPSWPGDKSRFPEIAPGNFGRVILNRPMGGGDYINAVYVDGFRSKGQFIASQLPLSNTVQDFWHLVMQTNTSLVIVLNTPSPHDPTTCKFWPERKSKLHLPDSGYVVLTQVIDSDLCSKMFLKIHGQTKSGGHVVSTQQEVEILMLRSWHSQDETPASADELIDLWQEAQHHYRGHGPIVVLCHDGARGCGLFLCSVFMLEKMKLEKEVDVGLAVRTSRLTRPHFITSLTQFAFLHYVARTYLEKYETYANFQ